MVHVFLAKAPANWKGRSLEHTLSPFVHDWGTRYVFSAPILVAELGFVQGTLGNVLGLVATGPGEPVLLWEREEPRGTEPNTGRHGLHFLSLLHSQTNASFPLCPVLAFLRNQGFEPSSLPAPRQMEILAGVLLVTTMRDCFITLPLQCPSPPSCPCPPMSFVTEFQLSAFPCPSKGSR